MITARGTCRLLPPALLLVALAFWNPASQASPPPTGAMWFESCPDCPKDYYEIGDRSLALDSQGMPHVVYAGDELHYAWHDGAAWQIEVVDQAPGIDADFQSPASLALDRDDTPHISYLSADGKALRYARRAPGGWQVETVDTTVPNLQFDYDTALALDSDGKPQISYFRNSELRHATWTGTAWRVETVDSGGINQFHISMALDSAGRPHISYYNHTTTNLRYAHRAGSGWQLQTVDDTAWLGEYNSIAIDSQDAPHVSYLDYTNSRLKYASQTPGGWVSQDVAMAEWFGGFTSLALDGEDRPRISFASSGGDASLASWTGAGWEILPFDQGVWYTSLALEKTDTPVIAYYGWNDRALVTARRAGTEWVYEPVDRVAQVGSHSALALDDDETAHISYVDSVGGLLKYATGEYGEWQFQTVDEIGPEGGYASLALDSDNDPRISYYDGENFQLKIARGAGGAWVSETVDSTAGVGAHSSLALDGADLPHISYHDATHGDLRYARAADVGPADARRTGSPRPASYPSDNLWSIATSEWHTHTVDSAGDVGLHTSLALDDLDRPHISYYDATHGDLRYAYLSATVSMPSLAMPGMWVTETVDSEDDVGRYTSLALDAEGRPHISYYDATHGDLRYARLTGGGWLTETVDSQSDVGSYSSLALDGLGRPQISYHENSYGGLKHARWTPAGWEIETVVSAWKVGDYCSLALDGQGRPHISFHDGDYRDLRYVEERETWSAYLPVVLLGEP